MLMYSQDTLHHCIASNRKEDTDINDKTKHCPYPYMQNVIHCQ